MGNNTKNVDTLCVVCGGKSFDFFVNKNNFDLYRCKNCGLIFVWPIPENLNSLYSQDYFAGAKHGFGYVNYEEDKLAMASTFNVYLKTIKKFSSDKKKLLDIGTATGFFVKMALEKGWEASGIEISEYAANVARKKGLNVITGSLDSVNFSSNNFDVITMWDVIEHLINPRSAIKTIKNILKQGGIVAINTPDSASLVAKVLGKKWHLLVPPEHLFYFSEKSLSKLLESSGFEVIYASKIGKKFTLQYVFEILARWQKFFIWQYLAEFFTNTQLGKFSIPINLRDNFFIIARKI